MLRRLWIVALVFAASGLFGCSDEAEGVDAGVDGAVDAATDADADADTDADADADTDADADADTDADADADADSDTDSDSDTDAECPYDCVFVFTCGGTVHDEYDCGTGYDCCEAADAGPACPWTCESYVGGCDGIGHTEYDCGMDVCCEPVTVEPDAGVTGDCVSDGYSCESPAYPLCDGDPIHFEESGCQIYEFCCG